MIYSDMTKAVNEAVLKDMNNLLSHRGPDAEGYFIKGSVGLGMRRLSIIDIQGGNQPIYNEDRTICIICNGEIYNYLELKEVLEKQGHYFSTHSDIEVIVHLYEQDAQDFIHKLRGMFAFALYDLKEGKLTLARDRIGIKPLYYTYQQGVFLFASELKAILAYPDLNKELCWEALSDYLTFLYIPAPKTIFKGIYKLLPAHVLSISQGNISLRQYWEVNYTKDKDQGEQYYGQSLKELLRETVKLHLMSEVPLGAFLSGGMDSSVIVALISEVADKPVKTFSVGFDIPDFNELRYANLVAKRFHTEHHEINLKPDIIGILPKIAEHFDEPFADSSSIPTYLLCEFAKQRVTVCLAGDGGDELFAGYGWTRRQKFIQDYNRFPKAIRRAAEGLLLGRSYSPDRRNKLLDKIRRFIYDASMPLEQSFMRRKTCFSEEMKRNLFNTEINAKLKEYASISRILPYLSQVNIASDMEKFLLADTKMYLPDDGLCKVDRMSMLHSLEVRVPFLDHKVVEFVASIPFKYKMQGLTSKYILKKTMASILPEELLRQRKLGFTIPLNTWFRGKLKNFSRDYLSPESKLMNFMRYDCIKHILDEHGKGNQDLGPQIYALIVLELWLRHEDKIS